MGMILQGFKHLSEPAWNRHKRHSGARVKRASPEFRGCQHEIPGSRWRARRSDKVGFLKIDPLAAVGAEQMQLFPWRNRRDPLADRGRYCAWNPHDHLARRQLPGIGGNALHLMLPGAVNEGLGSDALDGFDGEVERDAACD